MGEIGGVYMNFALCSIPCQIFLNVRRQLLTNTSLTLGAISLIPAWFVVKEIGTKYSKAKREHEGVAAVGGATYSEEFEKA